MKNLHTHIIIFFTIALLILQSCIGDDYVDDRVEPIVRITNPLQSIALDTTIQLKAIFLNNIGLEEVLNINWSSSDENIATINNNGFISGIEKGFTTIRAEVVYENETIFDDFQLEVTETTVVEPEIVSRTGIAMTTSFYDLQGPFILSEGANDNLILSFDETYNADTGLPGLYIYLSNNPNSVNGAFEIGAVTTFSGSHEYIIEDVGLFDYSHVLYFCKPFNVKVGDGELSE